MANGYKRIGRGGRPERFTFSQISLWRGADHVMHIERDGFNETYKRFYFADIESVTIRRDNRQRNYTIFLVIVLALLAWAAVVTTGFPQHFTFFWIVFFSIPLIVNLVKGPTCVTHLATAVQRLELQSLRRLRTAERALNEILESARATQGTMSAEEARVRLQLQIAPPIPSPPAVAPEEPGSAAPIV